MRVLVTGGVGVVGSFVVRKLLLHKIEPVVCDLRADFSLLPDLADRVEFIAADVTDLDAVSGRAAHTTGIDRIIHLAAFIDPDMDMQPFRAFTVNVRGTANMLEAARQAGIARFVFLQQPRGLRQYADRGRPAGLPASGRGASEASDQSL